MNQFFQGCKTTIARFVLDAKGVQVFLMLACLFGVLHAVTAQAASGEERLKSFFKGLDSLTADFKQVLTGEGGQVLQQSNGVLFIQRPGKFRWNYSAPYKQVLVADGKKLWHYDPDLAQVTVRPLDQAIGNTPALLLSGKQSPEENFNITDAGKKNGLEWIELHPKNADLNVERIRIGFAGDTIKVMEVTDSLGQVARIQFSNVKRNPRIDPNQFVFVPPAGTDVVGDQG